MNNGNQPINVVRGANNVPFDNDGFLESRSMVTGLTKREHFAGLAMQNIINRYNPFEQGDFDSSEYEIVAINAVGLADALLAELDK